MCRNGDLAFPPPRHDIKSNGVQQVTEVILDFVPAGTDSNTAVAMESSRIFVKNLPSTLTEAEFRKHFGANGREVTDIKLIPRRRIGYVGYKTPKDAADAVKYFNRSYIRMSKVAVEIARPVRATTITIIDSLVHSSHSTDFRPIPPNFPEGSEE